MGWSHSPDNYSATNTSEGNPFAGPKAPVPGKVPVQMPTEGWLCKNLEKLNTTLVESYPSRGLEAGGLAKDVFLRVVFRPQSRLGAQLNSSYSWIARHSGLSSTPPASCRISQETL